MLLFALQSRALPLFEQESAFGISFGALFVVALVVKFIVESLKPDAPPPQQETAPLPQPKTQEARPVPLTPEEHAKRLMAQRATMRRLERPKIAKEVVSLINAAAERTNKPATQIAETIMRELSIPCEIVGNKLNITPEQIDILRPNLERIRTYCSNLQ